MTLDDITFAPEDPAFDAAVEALNAEAFGPGRFARAAYRIREQGPHERALSFAALHESVLVGSVRMTRVKAGAATALLLGPLAVAPRFKKIGIGRRLVRLALEAASQSGAELVVLVGDEPYYGPLGFEKIPRGQVTLPRPVDLNRLLAHEIAPGAVSSFTGSVRHADL